MEAFTALRASDPGQVGPFRLVGRLGSGGMGSVYLGRSRGGRTVAVKVVRADLAEEAGFRRRFAREIAAAQRVNGAFTAGVVDADPDGVSPWLATAYVPGMALNAAVEAHGPWPRGPVLALGAGLAEALKEIHAVGVVHRDLKPSNVLLSQDGPRVIDFGISAVSEASLLTETGVLIGTPGFMSPEQLTGEETGPSSDVFALGAVLVYACTGTGPFGTGPVHAMPYRTLHQPPALADVPGSVREVVAACLEKEPERRPGVEELLGQLLSRVAEDGGDSARGWTSRDTGGDGWLPPLAAETVRSIAGAADRLPHLDAGADSDSGTGTGAPAGSVRPASRPAGSEAADTPKSDVSDGDSAGRTRRRALLGLTGVAAAAGLGIGGWVVGTGGGEKSDRSGRSRTGTVRWKTDRLTTDSPSGEDRTLPLTVANGLVYATASHSLYALSADRGAREWSYQLGDKDAGFVQSTAPTAAGGVVYVGLDESVHAVRATTGKGLWTVRADDDGEQPYGEVGQPVVRAGALYALCSASYRHWLSKVSARTGEVGWKRTEDSLVRFVGWEGVCVAVAGDTVHTHNDSVVHAWDVSSGRGRWRHDTEVSLQEAPIVADGTCFAYGSDVISEKSFAVALSAETGKELWKVRFAEGSEENTYSFDGIHAVSNGVALLYTGPNSSRAGLRALDARSGEVRWKRAFDSTFLSPPAVADGRIYLTADDSLYVLRVDTGKTVWRSSLGALVREKPVIVKDTVYLSTTTGKIYAVWA